MINSISATAVDKVFHRPPKYSISSVDGKPHSVSLFTNKLWDLIVLKLTELVHHNGKRFKWDTREEWDIYLSVHTIAECLDLSDKKDALTHLYDRIVAAANILRNIRITVDRAHRRRTDRRAKLPAPKPLPMDDEYAVPTDEPPDDVVTINGFLDLVEVRDCCKSDDYVTKSNAIFCFVINPDLIKFIETETPGLYHFNHCWLHLPEHSQNTYAAAKRLGRHYSQNTYQRKGIRSFGQKKMNIGTLRHCLPCLNNKVDKDNRTSLDNALKSIPAARFAYFRKGKEITFEELAKLRLRAPGYNELEIAIEFDDHPNTSDYEVTNELIRDMNSDALYMSFPFYSLEEAEGMIDHKGRLKKPVNTSDGSPPDKGEQP